MDDITTLKTIIEDLQSRLREETALRMELDRRCTLLEKLAYRDPMSGLRTESFLHTRVREEIDRAIRFPASTSLVTICAPQTAEHTVTQLGQRLSDELRSTDQVFSLTGDGLAILLVETPGDGAQQVLTRLSEDLEHFIRGFGYTVTSFPVDANLADDFLKLALDRHDEMARRIRPNPPDSYSQMATHH